MNTKILKTAKLSLTECNGSVQIRTQKVEKKLEIFFNDIKDEFISNTASKKKVKKSIKNILPKKTIKLGQEYLGDRNGHIDFLTKRNNDLKGYRLMMPMRRDKLSIENFGTMMHEFSHILTCLHNPKVMQRTCKISTIDIKYSGIKEFYAKEIYPKEGYKDLDRKLEALLCYRSIKEKVNFLQYWRYNLLNEKVAYKAGDKYQEKILNLLSDDLRNTYSDKIKPQSGKLYNLDEKILILNNKLAEVLSIERKLHAESLIAK